MLFRSVVSAVLFGLYHGNLVQGAFAVAIGLVLGYVALTYSLEWSIVLHILNNFAIGALPEMLHPLLGDVGVVLVNILIVIVFFALGMAILVRRLPRIRAYVRENGSPKCFYRWTFTAGGILLFTLLNLSIMVYLFFPHQ